MIRGGKCGPEAGGSPAGKYLGFHGQGACVARPGFDFLQLGPWRN